MAVHVHAMSNLGIGKRLHEAKHWSEMLGFEYKKSYALFSALLYGTR